MVGYQTFLPESWAVHEAYSAKCFGRRKNLRKFLLTCGEEAVILTVTVERGMLSVLHFLCSSPSKVLEERFFRWKGAVLLSTKAKDKGLPHIDIGFDLFRLLPFWSLFSGHRPTLKTPYQGV
jgi:hypothetical protein